VRKVEEINNPRNNDEMIEQFRRLLRSGKLQTIPQYLGEAWPMIRDKQERKKFADEYDRTRKPSPAILEKLRHHLSVSKERKKGVGLEIGCGTGNYTFQMLDYFEKISGLDLSEEMLDVARQKPDADRIDWRLGHALSLEFSENQFDAVWMISTLHYFDRQEQEWIFKKIYKWLRPGGRLVADIEFAEQHASLWVVEFFPSLKKRYEGVCLPQGTFLERLNAAGFKTVKFDHIVLAANDPDMALRMGQHHPKRYLQDKYTSGIPAFKEMPARELRTGRLLLNEAIDKTKIDDVIARYEAQATIPGDIGLIIAEK
jgi:ubiquinone/menaquinone biosynthesis C-methylase UbiE